MKKLGAKFFLPVIALLIVAPMAPTFAGDAATPSCVPVAGITPEITGTIGNLSSSSLTPKAGTSVTVTFDVSLSDSPLSEQIYFVSILGAQDENGDPWTNDSWGSPAKIVFGNQKKGTWSAVVAIPSTAVTGPYTVRATPSGGKTISWATQNIKIDGVAPAPVAPAPTGIITLHPLTTTTVAAGTTFDYTFDVSLSSMPSQPLEYSVAISPTEDEYGEPWTTNVWDSRPAALISGNNQKGTWTASLSIPTWATTGTYNIIPGVNAKVLLTSAGILPGKKILVPITINGVAPAPIVPMITGTIASHPLAITEVQAGTSIDFTYDVNLSAMPTTTPSYSAYVGGLTDENGDPWTMDQWNAPAKLISGNIQKGTWSASILIPTTAVTGIYQVMAGVWISKGVTAVGSAPTFKVNGIPPCTSLPTPVPTSSASGSATSVYLDQVHPSGTDILSADSAPLAYDKTPTNKPVAHIQIARGTSADKSQPITVSVTGPGSISRTAQSPMGKVLNFTEAVAPIIDLYFYADGTTGYSSIGITINGATVTKQISNPSIAMTGTGTSATTTPAPVSPAQTSQTAPKSAAETRALLAFTTGILPFANTPLVYSYAPCTISADKTSCILDQAPAEIACPDGSYKVDTLIPPLSGTASLIYGWEYRYCANQDVKLIGGRWNPKSSNLQPEPRPLSIPELVDSFLQAKATNQVPNSPYAFSPCKNSASQSPFDLEKIPEDVVCPAESYAVDLVLPKEYFKREGYLSSTGPMTGWEFKYCATGPYTPFPAQSSVLQKAKPIPAAITSTSPTPRPSATPGAVATPLATSSAAKTSLKSITCVKGKSSKIVKAIKPTCPKGWTLKK